MTPDKGEIIAEFEQERFELADKRILKICLGIFVAQIEKLQHKRIANFFVGRDRVFRFGHRPFAQHRGLVAGKGGPLVELAVDLPLQLSHRPAAAQGLGMIEGERFGGARA